MRYLYVLFVIICLVSCKTKSQLTPTIAKRVVETGCPENGVCALKIFQNKSLRVNIDELQGIYPEIINGGHLVLKFEYKKQENTNYQDSGYREEIFIELDKNHLEFETEDLKNKKLFFARWCYCKGQTGYYKINMGKLSVTKYGGKTFSLQLSFKVEEVPQIINEINHTFIIE
jgi:hypothetical protein